MSALDLFTRLSGWALLAGLVAIVLVGRTPPAGLWIATLAWVLILVQIGVGQWMVLEAGRAAPGAVKFHHRTMLAIVTLTALHVLLNGTSLHSILRAS